MRLKKFLSLCAMGIVAVLFVSSCKEEEEIQKTKDVRYDEFVMDNEYGTRMLLSINDMKIVPLDEIEDKDSLKKFASESDFDIAFAYYDPERIFDFENSDNKFSEEFPNISSFDYANHSVSEWPKYFFAGPTSVDFMRRTAIKYKKRITTFYNLPDNFTSSKFDSLKTVPGLQHVFESAKIVRNQLDKSSDIYFSDGSGWSGGTLIGFKTQEGKFGIIKVISDPYNYNRRKIGQIEIAVKFEGK